MSERSEHSKREEEVLSFWNNNTIFDKTLTKEAPKGEFVIYDGPPFATGLPHYGHLLPGTIKDVVPRYKTMQGYRVPRRWGWDCHGLPLEAQVEEVFGVTNKQDIIEKVGIETFVEKAKEVVLEYRDDWKKIIPRTGRFVDMDNDYRTMDSSYTESVWWVFKTLYEKGLIYKGFKSLHLSPLLGTELSNMEVAQGYKDITDFAVTVKLPLKGEDADLLVWTTTPWTLPGNMAAAVNPDFTYIKVKVSGDEKVSGTYIVAKEKLSLFADYEHEVLGELSGTDLIGKEYEPPFPYYQDEEFENKENAWRVYGAEYVTAEDGTGAVHLAPAFGAEDLELAQKEGVPIVHHVNKNGKFVDVVSDFAGMDAKPKGDHQATDIEIIKYLAHAGKLFKKEKIEHSYPHSWRTDEPLLNYAMDSWFVDVPKIKDQVVRENEKVNWLPKEIGSGRFGNWLKGARDWSISRSRFWGAPLPVWESESGKRIVLGSVEELRKYSKTSGNTYRVMRHGEAQTNAAGKVSDDDSIPSSLTEAGKGVAKEAATKLHGVTKIIASPLKRTQETARIVAKELGLNTEDILIDERIREIQFGVLNGKTVSEYHAFFEDGEELMCKRPDGGESWCDVKKRVGEFLYEIEKEYENENILIVTHNSPAFMLSRVVVGDTALDSARAYEDHTSAYVEPGEVKNLSFVPLPHNNDYELDFHRPYIDQILLTDGVEEYTRIQEVFDCWFESGSMPYGQKHYPFENTENFDPKGGLFRGSKGYPADLISEGLDQTRGWFYSLLILGVGLFGRAPYKNVIVHGTVLAEDGKKMSKKLKNYPELTLVIDKYGADALRYYILSSPLMRGEDMNFSEEGVREVAQKVIGRLDNVYAFYELYNEVVSERKKSTHILDRWIISRLHVLIAEVTAGLEAYELDKAARPVADFVDDLSTWYVRRSRDRIKQGGSDAAAAMHTLQLVLEELSKVIAPLMPFYAEYLFRKISTTTLESVHLAEWPSGGPHDEKLLEEMSNVRDVVSTLLELRQKAGHKVRQPLAQATVPEHLSSPEFALIIGEEVNVESVVVGDTISLDTTLTPELEEKGIVRELARAIQAARKESDLSPHDKAEVTIETTDPDFIKKHKEELSIITNAVDIQTKSLTDTREGEGVQQIGTMSVSIYVVKYV